MSSNNANENPFIGHTPVDTLNNCNYVRDMLIDAEPKAGDSVSEETIMGRQMIHVGIGDAIQHAIDSISGGEA
mgnify:CR=1 FL=1